MKKKTILTSLLAGVIAVGGISAIGCGGNNEAKINDKGGVFALNSQEEVYAYSAASAASLVADLGVAQTNGGVTNLSNVTFTDHSQYVDIVNNYINIAANMLKTDGGFTVTETVSDDKNYEYAMNVQCNGVFGESSEYTLYYNKTIINIEQDEGETEIEFNIDGKIITEGGVFTVKGSHEIEGNETEMEITVTVNDGNYIVVKQEREADEISYSYEVYINDQKIEETSFSHEYDDGEYEIKIEILKNGQTQEFKLSKKEVGETKHIDGKVKIGPLYLDFTIKVGVDENGEKAYEYQFNGITYKKDGKHLRQD